jgi:hypothetical protein
MATERIPRLCPDRLRPDLSAIGVPI